MVRSLLRILPLALATAAAAEQPQAGPQLPMSPEACHTRSELEAWRQRTEAQLLAFVPGTTREAALRTLQKDFEKRLAELEGRGDYRSYLAAHAGDFQRCTQLRQRVSLPRSDVDFPVLLATASMCRMERDLRVWRSCQLAEVQGHVPEAYRRFVVDVLRAQFEQRLAELAPQGLAPAPLPFLARLAATAPQLPASLAVAAVCTSEPELHAWRGHELAQIQGTVPKEYQHFAISSLERTFARRLAQLAARPAGPPVPATAKAPGGAAAAGAARPGKGEEEAAARAPRPDAPDVALELAGERAGVPHLRLKAGAIILCGLALPAAFSLLGAAVAARKRRSCSRTPNFAENGFHLQQV